MRGKTDHWSVLILVCLMMGFSSGCDINPDQIENGGPRIALVGGV
jgi:hypothetical protein